MFRTMLAASAAIFILSGCVIIDSDDDDGTHMGFGDSHAKNHYQTEKTTKPFSMALTDLQSAIDRRGLKTFAVIDHADGANSVGSSLSPTTLVIFGNPTAGTPLIQENRYMGLELPLKAMVWTDNSGQTRVSVTNIRHYEGPFDLGARRDVLLRIDGTLEGILAEATQ